MERKVKARTEEAKCRATSGEGGVNGREEQCQHPWDALAMVGKMRSMWGATQVTQLYPEFVQQGG